PNLALDAAHACPASVLVPSAATNELGAVASRVDKTTLASKRGQNRSTRPPTGFARKPTLSAVLVINERIMPCEPVRSPGAAGAIGRDHRHKSDTTDSCDRRNGDDGRQPNPVLS